MTAGGVAGVCIVRYSPLLLPCNLCLAFTFALCCLMFSRTTLIPLIIPQEGIRWLPLQAAIGAALFITIGMLVFQQCYKWSKAQLVLLYTYPVAEVSEP